MQEATPKSSLLGWIVSLAALVLGLIVMCLVGTVLAFLLRPGGWATNVPLPLTPTPAFVPVTTPTAPGAGMQASSEQVQEIFRGIPLPGGVTGQQAVGSEQVFSLIVQQPFERVVAFYQATMPQQEWSPLEPAAPPASQTVELAYEKDGRKAFLVITRMPFVGTIIEVTLIPLE